MAPARGYSCAAHTRRPRAPRTLTGLNRCPRRHRSSRLRGGHPAGHATGARSQSSRTCPSRSTAARARPGPDRTTEGAPPRSDLSTVANGEPRQQNPASPRALLRESARPEQTGVRPAEQSAWRPRGKLRCREPRPPRRRAWRSPRLRRARRAGGKLQLPGTAQPAQPPEEEEPELPEELLLLDYEPP